MLNENIETLITICATLNNIEKYRRPCKWYTEEELEYAYNLSQQGYMLDEIAIHLNRPKSSLSTKLSKRYGDEYSGHGQQRFLDRLSARPAHSIETKEKIAKTLTGKMVGNKNPFFGKTHSPETIAKIKDGIAKSSHLYLEDRKQRGEAQRGRKQSIEQVQKKSESMMGHEVSEQTRNKIGAAHKGKKLSSERKSSMRLTAANRKAIITPHGKFVSISLAAEHIGVIRKTISRWLESGKEGYKYDVCGI